MYDSEIGTVVPAKESDANEPKLARNGVSLRSEFRMRCIGNGRRGQGSNRAAAPLG
jgi:hypothetical protein